MNAILGARIRSLRESKGFTQEQVAEKVNFSRQKYARLERGLSDISYASITSIAQVLGVGVEDIIASVNNKLEQPMYRAKNNAIQEDKFQFINHMLETFYAHRKLYHSVRQEEVNE